MQRRDFLRGSAALSLSGLLPGLVAAGEGSERKPHILMLAVDDLRPQLGCYGNAFMHSPNMDALAAGGCLFERAYCNYPVCGASRASLLTGLRPTPERFTSYKSQARRDVPDAVPLHGWLKQQGYRVVGNGKVFHNPRDHRELWDAWHRPKEWKDYVSKEARRGKGWAWEVPEVDEERLQGGKVADFAIQEIRRAAKNGAPAFITAGFSKPHLPFIAPKQYWDLYDHEVIALAPNPFAPADVPEEAMHNYGELRGGYEGVPEQHPLPDDYARWLCHGYYACVSFTDAMIGRILNELADAGLADDTIVVLWGDHGWQLGEHGLWCKHSTFHTSLHSPLMVRVPGMQAARCPGLVEFVDIYPSMCELAGCPQPAGLEGDSFVPLLSEPERPWKDAVFAAYGKRDGRGECIITDRYSYTEFGDGSRMLYDHAVDPMENVNIADHPDHAAVVRELSQRLRAGWPAVRKDLL